MVRWTRPLFAAALLLAGATLAPAQDLEQVAVPSKPLVLKARGSFFVGGKKVHRTQNQLGRFAAPAGGDIYIDQMYVQFMVPKVRRTKAPLILVHGCCLTGKSWETTPDGRMGWDEYFVRNGHPVYVIDQVTRARSGFDNGVFNDVRSGLRPPAELPPIERLDLQNGIWTAFRIGPQAGTAYPGSQFPVTAIDKFAMQTVPDLYDGVAQPNPNFPVLSELASKAGGGILIGHSMGGGFVLEVGALAPKVIKGIINIEGGCPFNRPPFTPTEIANLAKMPILIVYGDYLDVPTGIEGFSWVGQFNDCRAFARQVNAAGGDVEILHLPEVGLRGNTHMPMLDMNSLEVAARIERWIASKVK